MGKQQHNKLSFAGIIIALGIIYGDIGTSPLYVLKAIVDDRIITEELIIGSISCIIWTLTLLTTVKYVILTLNADNKGEGGILSLFALVRRRKKWLVYAAMIGGAALLADGIITPPISVTSAIEGLRQIPVFSGIQQSSIIVIVLVILSMIFFLQQFGTSTIGKLFGPIMLTWFVTLAVMGIIHFKDYPAIFKAFNPYYAFQLLINYPQGFWILGGVFLCTTGAEALYSDLGHCGKDNIRMSWIAVQICLFLNYLGQGAWLLANHQGASFDTTTDLVFNPFFSIIPQELKLYGIAIATAAAIIASQALVSGSFTLIGEAIRLNLWPKMKISFPTEEKGQIYIPGINMLLWLGCCGIVLFFQESSKMEAAYGLAICICMISTSLLFANYMVMHRINALWIYLYLMVYLSIESSFLIANLQKFLHGGYVAVLVGGGIFMVMYVWYRSRKIKNRYVEFVRLEDYLTQIQSVSHDRSIPKYATHLVYMTSANNPKEIEHKIIYSILNQKPKRADIYWFVHVDVVDDPYTCDYLVDHIMPNDIIRVEFRLGFKIEQKVHLMLREVVKELVQKNEVNITSRYESLSRNKVPGDVQVIVLEKYLSQDNELPFAEKVIMKLYFWIKEISLSEERGFGLDPSTVVIEKFPLIVAPVTQIKMKRIHPHK